MPRLLLLSGAARASRDQNAMIIRPTLFADSLHALGSLPSSTNSDDASNVESGGGEREVVRLVTSYWRDSRGLHMKKDLLALRRQSSGYQRLEEDADMAGADLVFSNIINLHECGDGVYLVVMCNQYKDWETGHLEDWDYKLIPLQAAGAVGEATSSAEKETNGRRSGTGSDKADGNQKGQTSNE